MTDHAGALGSPSPSRPADARVLLVEDDASLIAVVSQALGRSFDVEVATTGGDALHMASTTPPDVVVLDLGLPDIDGLDVCSELRRWYRNPIVVLSADGAEDRKVAALDLGADDYVTKPFSMPELQARLRVALRHRRTVALVVDDVVLEVGSLRLDTGAHTASLGGAAIELTRKEHALLSVLARNVGRVLTHGALLAAVWGEEGPSRGGSLRVHVNQVRKKLAATPGAPLIESVPGVGYRLLMSD